MIVTGYAKASQETSMYEMFSGIVLEVDPNKHTIVGIRNELTKSIFKNC